MGAIEKNNAIYLNIADGQISHRVMQPTAKSITRTTKTGKVVHEEFKKGWGGFITDIKVSEHREYGKKWNVTISDDEGSAVLQMDYSSGYSRAFLKTLPNVDLSKEVTIVPFMKMDGEKKETTIFVSQKNAAGKFEALPWFYKKDDPNGIPELAKIKVKGKIQYDDSDIMEFLENMVNKQVLPILRGASKSVSIVPPVKAGASGSADPIEDMEDAPF